MLRELSDEGLFTQQDVLKMIGARFRIKLPDLPPWYSDIQVAKFLLGYDYTLVESMFCVDR